MIIHQVYDIKGIPNNIENTLMLKKDILEQYAKGLTQDQIATKLKCAQSTVSQHLSNAKRKAERDGMDPGYVLRGKSVYDTETHTWTKTERDREFEIQTLHNIAEALANKLPKFSKIIRPKVDRLGEGYKNTFIFGDPHINMYTHGRECGANWDTKIAIKRHTIAMRDMICRAPPSIDATLVTTGDIFHSDSLKAITPEGGNIVDIDGRLVPAAEKTVEMLRLFMTWMLQIYRNVDVVIIPGNHSPTLERMLAIMLRIAAENEPRLNIIDNTAKHIPLVWEKNFQLFTHGDRLTKQKKADIATAKFRKEHGSANFSHCISGHLHHYEADTISGVFVEIYEVLCPADAWHNEGGFVTADHSATVLRYHHNGGISDRITSNPRFWTGDLVNL